MTYRSKPMYLFEPSFNTPEIENAMKSFFNYRMSNHELQKGCLLYHYTTSIGLKGILKDRAFWCSHTSTLNDPFEIKYGQKLIAEVLKESIDQENREDLHVFLEHMLDMVKAFDIKIYHTFVACFCKSDNLLSQWKGYSSKGDGYCIGIEFSSSTLFSSDLNDLKKGMTPFLFKVIYNKKEQQELVLRYVREVTEAAKIALDSGIAAKHADKPRYAEYVMSMQAVQVLFNMLFSFKHPAFESEEEWRLVWLTGELHQPEKLCFRETSSGLSPYRVMYIYNLSKYNHTKFPLRSIRFGPMLDTVKTKTTIQLLLNHIAADGHPIILKNPDKIQINGAGYSLR
jgi:Protein of unknown function (DUF2971)